MNAHTHTPITLTLVSAPRRPGAANDNSPPTPPRTAPPPRSRASDPIALAHVRFARQLRAAARQYVAPSDVDDLCQDTWLVASRSPAKLAASDSTALSWLIGVAKRCAPAYVAYDVVEVPLDELLLREAGDDAEGCAMHAAPKRGREKRGRKEREGAE